jgi:hypothetical protein
LGFSLWGKPEEAVRLLSTSGAAICRSVAEDLPNRTASPELLSAVEAVTKVDEDVEASLEAECRRLAKEMEATWPDEVAKTYRKWNQDRDLELQR